MQDISVVIGGRSCPCGAHSSHILVSVLLGLAALLVGCAGFPMQSEPVVVKRAQMQMGTLVSITVVARNEAVAQAAATAGFAEIRRLEELLSTWISSSELSQVNASAGIKPVHVSTETLTVVQRAMQAAEMTDGGFNIAIGPAVEAWSVTDGQRIPDRI